MEPRRILLAEDDQGDEELFRVALAKANIDCEVDVVRDGTELIDYLFVHSPEDAAPNPIPDLIVLDLKMPRMDGIKVLRMLQSVRGGPSYFLPPIVIFTSSDEAQDRSAAYGYGAHSFVRKPVNFGRYVETVQQTVIYWLSINQGRPRPGNAQPAAVADRN